ncbi:hypothetical protein FIBSPDRAFT_862619, partial [Athelia psychrophila]
MEVNSLLSAVPEPTRAEVNRTVDSRLREHREMETPSVESLHDCLEGADRAQGDELARQAGLTASAILAQQQQRNERNTMMSQLSEAQAGLAEARNVADAQAAQIADLVEQLRVVRECAEQTAKPTIDSELLLGEVTVQARAAMESYTNSVRKELEERERIVASHVWQAMEPARQLI